MGIGDYIDRIICGDCIEVMAGMPGESIDLVVTSPPYNLGNNHHTNLHKHTPYHDDMPEVDYQRWQIIVINECMRLLNKTGSMFYNHKNRIKNGISISPYEWLLKTNAIIKQEIIWFNGSQNFDKCRFYPMTERVYWLGKTLETNFYNHINHHDIFDRGEWPPQRIEGIHSRQFPVQMVLDIFACFPSNLIVLDPFMGSGTVAVACMEYGHSYIGIDISEEYCKIARERVVRECSQLRLLLGG